MGVVIALSGPHGSGKSTYGKMLAEEFNFRHITIGLIFREMAKEKKLTLEEFSSYVEKHPEIDKELDERIILEAKKGNNVLIDSQLSAWMTQDLSQVKIYLTAPTPIRIKRIALRDDVSYEKAEKETLTRENSEKKRYKELYNIDISDLSIYDIIINTNIWSIVSTFEILKVAVIEYLKNH
ncbi:MAG: (d)CMP kinase [Promethearchaeota archaeon]